MESGSSFVHQASPQKGGAGTSPNIMMRGDASGMPTESDGTVEGYEHLHPDIAAMLLADGSGSNTHFALDARTLTWSGGMGRQSPPPTLCKWTNWLGWRTNAIGQPFPSK